MTKPDFIRTAKPPFKARYGNYIGGAWAEPAAGRYFDNVSPVNGQVLCQIPPLGRDRHRTGAGRRPRRQGRLGPHQRRRARHPPEPHRPGDGGQPRPAGRGRDLGQRQADPRDHRRRPAAGHRPLPLFRRLHPRPGRRHLRDRPRHRRLSLPRAAGRRRPDHPLELPAADGLLEAGPGHRRRQLRGAQARRTDPGLDPVLWAELSATSCRRACSTSSTATAWKPASRWPPARASPRSPSPARPPPAG